MSNVAPIGIFDSGVGGLTVARSIIDQLPCEHVRYVGDTANGPYGPLAIDEVLDHAMAVADHLVDSGVKMLVIACNTASAAGAFEEARAPLRHSGRRGHPTGGPPGGGRDQDR